MPALSQGDTVIDFSRAKSLVTMSELLKLISWKPQLMRSGWLRGSCPIHAKGVRGESISFSVNLKTNTWRCHSRCRRGGNVLDLYAAISGQPLYPATVELFRRLGRELPRRSVL